jgi:hypothetical protein
MSAVILHFKNGSNCFLLYCFRLVWSYHCISPFFTKPCLVWTSWGILCRNIGPSGWNDLMTESNMSLHISKYVFRCRYCYCGNKLTEDDHFKWKWVWKIYECLFSRHMDWKVDFKIIPFEWQVQDNVNIRICVEFLDMWLRRPAYRWENIITVGLTYDVGAGLAQAVCLTTGWKTKQSGFDHQRWQRIFSPSSVSRPALGST